MGQAALVALMGVCDRDAPILVIKPFDNLLLKVADHDYEIVDAEFNERVEDVLDEGTTRHLDERFRLVVGEWLEAGALASGKDNGLDASIHIDREQGGEQVSCYPELVAEWQIVA